MIKFWSITSFPIYYICLENHDSIYFQKRSEKSESVSMYNLFNIKIGMDFLDKGYKI